MTITTTATNTFIKGQNYSARSICDSECIWNFVVLKRTAKFVTVKDIDSNETKRCGVFIWDETECIRPHGNYSMATVLRAE